VTNPDFTKTYPGRERQPARLEPFLSHDTAIAAGLEKPEVIALRLFTGPMVRRSPGPSDPSTGWRTPCALSPTCCAEDRCLGLVCVAVQFMYAGDR
jgi:hypothetical protein